MRCMPWYLAYSKARLSEAKHPPWASGLKCTLNESLTKLHLFRNKLSTMRFVKLITITNETRLWKPQLEKLHFLCSNLFHQFSVVYNQLVWVYLSSSSHVIVSRILQNENKFQRRSCNCRAYMFQREQATQCHILTANANIDCSPK